jgi:periplasmic protein CpxP/Spy
MCAKNCFENLIFSNFVCVVRILQHHVKKHETMKSIKILIASLLLSTSLMAQKSPEERAAMQTEKMTTELSLTPDQKEKILQINLGIVQKNDGVRNSEMSEEEKKKSLKMNNDARETMFKEVLTPEQFTIYQFRKEEMKTTQKNIKKEGAVPAQKEAPQKN